ncbi:MAG TPA: NADH-ubiquinone oxidoreductase-F iron-sulfur binding region domain-containing protein, partial [Actinotalea sp.]|nr:NADH-ubiquinone oxidoreductase-F iron-sulfur binding region domain-containing protein [Actinotalea sp.]
YLAGESNAIARALAGGPSLPTVRRLPGPGEPSTLVQNVETLARLALVARGHRPTTVLLTVLTPTGRRVVEVERTTRLADLLSEVGWSLAPAPEAILVGGYGGMWVAWHRAAGLRLDPEDFRSAGFSLGAGVLVPLPPGACGVVETAALTTYLASMSARQCGPCLFGLPALAGSLQALAAGRARPGELERLHDDVRAVEGRGACRHPDGATRLIASAVRTFGDHLADHAAGHPCRDVPRSVLPMPTGER